MGVVDGIGAQRSALVCNLNGENIMIIPWRTPKNPRINLALQGGGAHGAFTWGVLDALLEDGRMEFDGVSGTSAGAMNSVVLAHGLMQGGYEGARAALEKFWLAVADSPPIDFSVPGKGDSVQLGIPAKLMMQFAQLFSPHQLNPFNFNPLRDIVEAQIDFAALREHCPVNLFIAATHANSGKLRLFRNHEMCTDVLLASACLPTIHHPVVIAGEPYWDGGYSANPAVFPLLHETRADDTLMVLLTPITHPHTPRSAGEIKARILEISFNAAFLREMRGLADVREQLQRSWLSRWGRFEQRTTGMHFHLIEAEDFLGNLSVDTKLIANRRFFETLRKQGSMRAQRWLEENFGALGKRSTVDLRALFG